ncbi:acyl transferase/acyl hydrolase/lysophospholipase [Flagelloscypha sp. PMI_526]|nr:acyl transferase/acyl hydrolase/lysophospholipase [Flagelloscypha sp. PMI_526]
MRQVAALSLDGGGLLALSELYTIREVMQRLAYVLNLDSLPLPCEHFDVIGGSGSGGIIALLLGCLRMDVDQAIESFIQLYQALYGQLTQQESPEANWPSFSFAIDSILAYFLHNYDGLYRSESSDETAQYPLKTDKFVSAMRILIEMHLPDHGSEATLLETDSSCKTFVCAMPSMALTGRNSVKLFRNFRPRGNASFDCKIWEAALATTAHPRFCQPVKIGPLLTPQSYIDAGYGYNNPVKQVIEQTEAKFELSNSVYCFLSLGAGNPGVSGQSAQQRNSDWASLLEAIATDCERTAEQMDRSSKQGYVRINVEQGFQDIRLADWVDPGMVEAHTTNHLSQFAVGKVVDEVVDFLIERHHKVSGMLAMSRASGVLPQY